MDFKCGTLVFTLFHYLTHFFFLMVYFLGNIGSELSYNNVAMFISSDAGNNWRQVWLLHNSILKISGRI